eukprot:TRINITY_DN8530_c0_g1_i4.p1 TRINITY_DN8530_c0_g1~~TRINITY_DN8530_c0_g1_i4.p1  ORF type:complete len:1168 (+),score=275.69 TRINITY_DN8530_c0_g1_i4:136-3504(+)
MSRSSSPVVGPAAAESVGASETMAVGASALGSALDGVSSASTPKQKQHSSPRLPAARTGMALSPAASAMIASYNDSCKDGGDVNAENGVEKSPKTPQVRGDSGASTVVTSKVQQLSSPRSFRGSPPAHECTASSPAASDMGGVDVREALNKLSTSPRSSTLSPASTKQVSSVQTATESAARPVSISPSHPAADVVLEDVVPNVDDDSNVRGETEVLPCCDGKPIVGAAGTAVVDAAETTTLTVTAEKTCNETASPSKVALMQEAKLVRETEKPDVTMAHEALTDAPCAVASPSHATQPEPEEVSDEEAAEEESASEEEDSSDSSSSSCASAKDAEEAKALEVTAPEATAPEATASEANKDEGEAAAAEKSATPSMARVGKKQRRRRRCRESSRKAGRRRTATLGRNGDGSGGSRSRSPRSRSRSRSGLRRFAEGYSLRFGRTTNRSGGRALGRWGRGGGGKGWGGDSVSPRRSRSRSPAAQAFPRGTGAGSRSRVTCWFGRDCRRAECWYDHPEGRRISKEDMVAGRGGRRGWHGRGGASSPAGGRRRGRRFASRSASSSRSAPSRMQLKRSGNRGLPPPPPLIAIGDQAMAAVDGPIAGEIAAAAGGALVGNGGAAIRSRSPSRWEAAPADRVSPSQSASASRSASAGRRDTAPTAPTSSGNASAGAGGVSFRNFVMTECDDSVDATEAMARFEKLHKEAAEAKAVQTRLLKEQIFERLRGTRLLFDLYHPLSVMRCYDQRVTLARANAEAFMKDMAEGRFRGLSLRAPSAGTGEAKSRRPTAGHLAAPHFAFDPDVNALAVEALPADISVWDILDTLQESPAVQAVSVSKPSGKEAQRRDLRMRFSSGSDVAEALKIFAADAKFGTASLRPTVLQPREVLEALVLPPEMSLPARLREDLTLSAQVVRKLNAAMLIPQDITEALVSAHDKEPVAGEASDEAKLDLQVLYLRRVHHFCFYAAVWCEDEWELFRRCGPALLRDEGGEAAGQTGGNGGGLTSGVWTAAHTKRLTAFLAKPRLERPTALSLDEEPLRERCEVVCNESVREAAAGKYQCTRCSKFFRGPEYVVKHVRKMHLNLLEALRQEAHAEAAKVAFLAEEPSSLAVALTAATQTSLAVMGGC